MHIAPARITFRSRPDPDLRGRFVRDRTDRTDRTGQQDQLTGHQDRQERTAGPGPADRTAGPADRTDRTAAMPEKKCLPLVIL